MRFLFHYINSNGNLIRKQQFSTYTGLFIYHLNRLSRKRQFSEKNNEEIKHTIKKTIVDKIFKHFHETKHEPNKKKFKINSKVTTCASIILVMCYLVYNLGSPDTDPSGNVVKDDLFEKPIIVQYFIRIIRELRYYRRLIKTPGHEKLLPDPLQFPYLQPKYTLVLELTDVLIHPEWSKDTGWRYKKRPLLNYFLESLGHYYEIVIYTKEQGIVAFPLIEAIDPKKIIAHKLVRNATCFTGGIHIKTLDKLNRNLSKVICIDWNPKRVKFNPDNLFKIKRWTGQDNDTSLIDLTSFLKNIATNDVEDVREVLKYYRNFDDPVEAYKEKQRRLIEELEEQAAAEKENSA